MLPWHSSQVISDYPQLPRTDPDVPLVVPVFVASKRIAIMVQFTLICSIFGMLLFLFVPTGMHKHTNDPSFLVQSGLGVSGWNSGTAWVLGITNCMYAFGATDGGNIVPSCQQRVRLTQSSHPH